MYVTILYQYVEHIHLQRTHRNLLLCYGNILLIKQKKILSLDNVSKVQEKETFQFMMKRDIFPVYKFIVLVSFIHTTSCSSTALGLLQVLQIMLLHLLLLLHYDAMKFNTMEVKMSCSVRQKHMQL